jgi:hypothetical protein
MGIISAGVVHNASTPKHAAKVSPKCAGRIFFIIHQQAARRFADCQLI